MSSTVSRDFPIRQHTLYRMLDPAQKFGDPSMLGREIANIGGRGGIARFQLLENRVLLWVMVGVRTDLGIRNDGSDKLVIRPLRPIEDAQLPLENEE